MKINSTSNTSFKSYIPVVLYGRRNKEEGFRRVMYSKDNNYLSRCQKQVIRTLNGTHKNPNKEFLDFYHIRHHETPGGSYQDVGFYLRTLYDAQRVYFLDKAFYMWRQDNPGSSIHYNSKKLVEKSTYEWSLNKKYLSLRKDATKRMWGSFNYRRYYSYLWTIDMALGDDKKDMIRYAKKELKEALKLNQVDKIFFDDDEWYQFKKFIGE